MKNFKTYQLALKFHNESMKVKLEDPYRDQFSRASLSIVFNLSEGSAKNTKKSRRRFYYISLGSLREVQTVIEILELEEIKVTADILGAHLYKLCRNCQ